MPTTLEALGFEPETQAPQGSLESLGFEPEQIAAPTDPLKRKITRAEDLPSDEEFQRAHDVHVAAAVNDPTGIVGRTLLGMPNGLASPLWPNAAAHPAPKKYSPADIPKPAPMQGTPNDRFRRAVSEGLNTPLVPLSKIPYAGEAAGAFLQTLPGGSLIPDQVATGLGKAAVSGVEGLTTPANVGIAAATEGLGAFASMAPKAVQLAQRVVSAGFSADMLRQAYESAPDVKAAFDSGDQEKASEALGKFALNIGMGVMAGHGAIAGHGTPAAASGEIIAEGQQFQNVEKSLQPPQNPDHPVTEQAPPALPAGPQQSAGPAQPGSASVATSAAEPATVPAQAGDASAGGARAGAAPRQTNVPPNVLESMNSGMEALNRTEPGERREMPNARGIEALGFEPEPEAKANPQTLESLGFEPEDSGQLERPHAGASEPPQAGAVEQAPDNGAKNFTERKNLIPDVVSLYRGEHGGGRAPEPGSDVGKWFTPDLEQAKAYGGGLQRVDVPRADYERLLQEEEEHQRAAPGSNPMRGQGVLLPDAVAREARPFTDEGPLAPVGETRLPETGGVARDEAEFLKEPQRFDPERSVPTGLAALGFEPEAPMDWRDTFKPEVSQTLTTGAKRINHLGGVETLVDVPIDRIQPTEGNRIYPQKVEEYRANPSPIYPELRLKPDGSIQIHEGHHRIEAAKLNGEKSVRAWVAREGPGGHPEIPLPGTLAQVRTSDLAVDPARFQFKQAAGGKAGVTDEFQDVRKFDPEKAGIISVWRDPEDGRTYVVNGHHRVEMAQRLGAPDVTVRYLDAKNAMEARTKGALINIGEGRGTALDAAKVFRDSAMGPAELEKEGVSVKGEMARQGLALAKLDPHLFRKVVEGDLPVERAAVIGEGVDNPNDQRALYDELERSEKNGKRLTNDQVGEMIRLANAAPKVEETQDSLFGSEQVSRSLIKEKAEVSDYIRKRLGQEKKLFATVGNDAAAERLASTGNKIEAGENAKVAERTGQAQLLYDKLSTTAGPVSDALDNAASLLASGEDSRGTKERAYKDIKSALLEQASRLAGERVLVRSERNAGGETGAREASGERSEGNAPARNDTAGSGQHDRPFSIFGESGQEARGGISPEEPQQKSDPEIEALKVKLAALEKKSSLHPALQAAKDRTAAQSRKANAAKLRKLSEGLDGQIEQLRNPAIAGQNPTARRAGIIDGMRERADSLARTRGVMRKLADAHENGTIPPVLHGVTSRALVEDLLSSRGKYPDPFIHKAWIKDIQEKLIGRRGMKDALKIITRPGDENGIRLRDSGEAEALYKLGTAAKEEGLKAGEWIRDAVAPSRRLDAAGIGRSNWEAARAAIKALDEPPKADAVRQKTIAQLERNLIGQKIEGYFPTPKPLVERMLESADVKPGMKVLEPSAGKGNIADELRAAGAHVDTVEPVSGLRDVLEAKGHNVVGRDFLAHRGEYDRIVMNPPFERGQDMEHVQHAYELLKPGGKLVSIMSEGPFFRQDRKATEFRDWLDKVGGVSEKVPDAFKGKDSERQTGVVTRVVQVIKQALADTSGALRPRKIAEGMRSLFDESEKAEPQELERFTNEQDGTEATIAPFHKGGFSVALKDTDAGEFVPTAKVFDTIEAARRYAKDIVGQKEVEGASAKDSAQSAASYQDRLARDRMEAQLKAPLTRDEQLRKLKPGEKPIQDGLFERAKERPQQSLFAGEDHTPGRLSDLLGDTKGGVNPESATFGAKKFIERDVKPALDKVADALAEAHDQATRLMAPASRSRDAELMGLSLRQRMAQFARRYDLASQKLRAAEKFFESRPPEENFNFIDHIEQGRPTGDAALDQIAGQFRKMLDSRRQAVQALGEGALDRFYRNYFPHIFEKPSQAGKLIDTLLNRKSSIEGPAAFLKHRSFPTVKEAMANGMKPISDNPVTMVLAKVREMDRYLMAHHVLRDMGERGIAVRVAEGGFEPGHYAAERGGMGQPDWIVPSKADVPPTFVGIADPVGGGKWYAEQGAADVLNNYLTPGLRARSGAYRILAGINNTMNQANLGLSAFHLTGEIIRSGVSRAALGIEDILNGNPVRGSLRIASFPAGPFLNLVKGNKVLSEWFSPGKEGAPIAAMVDAMMQGGGRARLTSEYTNEIAARMVKEFRQGNLPGALLRLPAAVIEKTAAPMMKELIPRLKAGVFADLAASELERLGPGASVEDARKAMAKVWDSVDNRMGQVVYDNLFWNKTAKDLLHLSVRSVGWNLGTIREAGGGVKDLAGLIAGRKPEANHRLAYTLALPVVSGLIGALYQYAHTGKGPQELKDYLFPKREDGSRIALPTDVKDVYHWGAEPLKTAENKVSPLANTVWEMINNEDYYRRPIRNPQDPLIKQAEQELGFIYRQTLPFTLQNSKAKPEPNPEHRAENFLGIQRAPAPLQPGYTPRHIRQLSH